MRGPSLAVIAALSTGCATTLSTHQLAKTIDPGHVEATIGMGGYIPAGAGTLASAEGIKQAQALLDAAKNNPAYTVSDADREKLITAGLALFILPPSPSQEISLRTGILKSWDAGLRYSVNAVRLDTKYQLVHQDNGPDVVPEGKNSFDVAVGLGVSKYLFSNPIIDVLDMVQLGDFSRWDVEVPVYLSWEWGYIFRAYLAPKYVLSYTEMDENLVTTSELASTVSGLDLSLQEKVPMHFFGASVGLMAGYRWAWVSLELTGGYTYARPFVLGQARDIGGLTLYPSIALNSRF